jgi:hypothetical protein
MAAAIAADRLGKEHTSAEAFSLSGTAFGLVVCAAGLFGVLLGNALRKEDTKRAILGGLLGCILLLLGGYVVGARYLDARDTWTIFCGAAFLGIVVHWLVPNEDSADPLRILIAAIIWIGAGTIAFQLRQGYGIAIALIGGASPLIFLGNRRAVLTLGGLGALAMYRIFREDYTDATRALDIGQHYALIGVSLGAVLPLLPGSWLRYRRPGVAGSFAGVVWIILVASASAFIAIILGPKAVIGYLAGFGFAAIVEALSGGRSLLPFSLGFGLAAWTNLLYDWLGDSLNDTREQKMKLLLPIALSALILIVVIAGLSRRSAAEVAE